MSRYMNDDILASNRKISRALIAEMGTISTPRFRKDRKITSLVHPPY